MCTSGSRAFTTKGPRTMTNERQRTTGAIIPARTRAPIPVNSSNARVCSLHSFLAFLAPCPTSGQLKIVHDSRRTIGIGTNAARLRLPIYANVRCEKRENNISSGESYPPLFTVSFHLVESLKKDPSFESTPWLLVFLFLWERFSAT